MKLETRNGITTRQDGLPYDVVKTENGYAFRAIGNPAKPVVIATTKNQQDAIMMLVAQAPEDTKQLQINTITRLLASPYITKSEKALLATKLAKVGA